jgi:putative transposase
MVDDPAHYRWSSYRTNGLGQSDSLLTPHAVYSSLGANEADRLVNYRSLFRPELDTEAISDIRMALDQGQPLGDARFIDSIERATGQRREIRPRGRPRKAMLEETGPQDQKSLDM